jgi:predicted nucleic acid-binding protein
MRGNSNAFNKIERLPSFSISVVTYSELVQGMRNKRELNELRISLRNWNALILYITEEISAKAMFYVEQHFLSHSFQLADSLICATAIVNGLPLLTANVKHYRSIRELEIQTFKP